MIFAVSAILPNLHSHPCDYLFKSMTISDYNTKPAHGDRAIITRSLENARVNLKLHGVNF